MYYKGLEHSNAFLQTRKTDMSCKIAWCIVRFVCFEIYGCLWPGFDMYVISVGFNHLNEMSCVGVKRSNLKL